MGLGGWGTKDGSETDRDMGKRSSHSNKAHLSTFNENFWDNTLGISESQAALTISFSLNSGFLFLFVPKKTF